MSVGIDVIETWRDLPPQAKGAAVALGAFDGVHRGHQAVIATAAEAAARLGAPLGVVTFSPHPRQMFVPDGESFRLTNAGQQARAFERAGVQRLYRLTFDPELAALTDEAFVREVLVEGLGVRHVSAGADITFGKGRSGGPDALRRYGERFGFEVTIAPLLEENGRKCSSSAIRQALKSGKPELAAALLGRPFAVAAEVVHGDHLGRTIGFPTANMELGDYVRPSPGIYASRSRFPNGREVPGVAYIGRRPTVDGHDERLEVNLFDFDEDIYGQVLETDLVAFIRGDQRFASLDEMKAQMAKDCQAARTILAKG